MVLRRTRSVGPKGPCAGPVREEADPPPLGIRISSLPAKETKTDASAFSGIKHRLLTRPTILSLGCGPEYPVE